MKSAISETSELTYSIVAQEATITGVNMLTNTTLVIPTMISDAKVVAIEPTAFEGCSYIEKYEVEGDSPVFKTIEGVLFSKDGKRLISYPRGSHTEWYRVPEGVLYVEPRAFARETKLKSIDLRNVRILGHSALKCCTSLEEIRIGKFLEKIGPFAFSFCTRVKEMEFASCAEIGDWAWAGAFRMSRIWFHEPRPRLSLYSFADLPGKTQIGFGNGCVCYKAAELNPAFVALAQAETEELT